MNNDTRSLSIPLWKRLLDRLGIYIAIIFLFPIGLAISPEFFSGSNLLQVVHAVTLLGIVATGCAFITYSGHYVDLSIPAIMASSGLVAVSALPFGIAVSIISGLATGLGIGLINGYVIGYLRLNPIIWTLAMAFFLDGFIRWIYGGHQVYPDATTSAGAAFISLARGELVSGIPYISIIWLVLAAVSHWLVKRSRFGAHVELTGAAYDAAAASGIDTRRVTMSCLCLSALASALAGILLTSLSKQGTFTNGLGYDFNAITAIVLGGVMLTGGKGSIIGVTGGVLFVGLLSNIMTLAGMGYFSQLMLKGVVFIAVVGTTSWLSRKSGKEEI